MIIRTNIRRKDNKIKSATGAVNYVLSDFDSEKKLREVKPKVKYGNPDLIRSYDNHPSMKENNKSTSGVIAFRDNEKLTEEQKDKFIEQFIELAIPEQLTDKVDMLIVEHNDKGNIEFHFIIPHLTNEGKTFNPFPVIGKDRGQTCFNAVNAMTAILNNNFNFQQVERTDLKNGLSSDEFKHSKYIDFKSEKYTQEKEQFTKYLKQQIKQKDIKNKTELVEFLEKKHYKISRNGDNYLTIIPPNTKTKIKLNGGIYANNSQQQYTEIKENKGYKELKKYTPENLTIDKDKVKLWHNIIIDKYTNQQKNTLNLSKQYFNNYVKNDNFKDKKDREKIQDNKHSGPQGPCKPMPQGQGNNGLTHSQKAPEKEGLGGQAISSGVAQAESNLQSALSELSQAEGAKPKDMNRVLKAKIAVAQALAQVENAKKLEAEQQDNQRKKYRI